ncbi:MAG: polyprenol monophosphomannose synthase [Kiritimatiellae bacterium]|nr:polyprenol monophosphomannose synthase [Kiritimatiellia bacterium]
MNDILAVIPTYNERESIQDITRAVFREYEALDILFVDDNSPDGTGQLADAIAAKDPRVHVLHRSGKQGLGRAYIAGFKWALEQSYQFIFEMDADFSHNPADIPRLLLAAQKADLVLGSRYIGGVRVINWPLNRLILSRGAGIYVQLITGMPFTDPTGGFKCYRRAVLEEIDLDAVRSNGYSFQIEMTHKTWQMGFQIQDVPITFEERRSGLSKMNTSIVREALWMVWKLWFQAGLRRTPRARHPRSAL